MLAVALYLVGLGLGLATDGFVARHFVDPDRLVHLLAMLLTGAVYFFLRRKPFPARTLRMLDALGLYVSLGAALAILALLYDRAPHTVSAVIAIFVIARAVVVPSSALKTVLLSLPAPLGYLAVQLWFGVSYMGPGVVGDAGWFTSAIVWHQAVLGLAVVVAGVASHINHGLREQAAKARRLGQYKLEERIGAGGMGEVYRATHAMLRRPTAVKLLHPEITGRETLGRFEREVQETSRLSHPNTISIYDYGHTPDGVFYYAMELLDGADLKEIVAAHGPFPPGRVVHVLRQACGALREAHGHDLIHRDIKPGNLMLCRSGGVCDVVKVVDFGLVKDLREADSQLTQVGSICGTPETLAPELVAGQPASPRSDLYALGCVGYYLLTGVPVWEVNTALEYISHHTATPPPPLRERNADVPEDLAAVVMRCLEKEPADRYQDAAELLAALDACNSSAAWTEADAAGWWRAR